MYLQWRAALQFRLSANLRVPGRNACRVYCNLQLQPDASGISQDLVPRAHTRPPLALRTCLMVITACRGPRTADRRRQDIRAARLLPCRSKLIEKIVPTDRERSATNPPQLMLGYNCRCSAAIADRLQIHSAGFPPKGWIRAKIAQLQMQIANTLCRLPRPRGDRNKKSSVAIGDCKYRTLSAGISP